MIFNLDNYDTRKELEQDIILKVGNDPNANIEHSIEGTPEQLRNLFLSTRTSVFGVKCVISEPNE